ncbi:MAG TPA: hypothetical protein VG734_03195 [Lacunisphaera sp.]|nr:hypothetical protein [Lacunisphaera sp.]
MLSGPTSSLSALRQLLATRFPTAAHGRAAPLVTGLPGIDELTGGLPRPALTEMVCAAPSCGSQLFLGQLLAVTRAEAWRLALVDAGDAFAPDSWPPAHLEHLVWIRARDAAEAMAAADLLARDANFALLALDLRHAPRAQLRRIPSTSWYRLQRALEPTTLATVVLTPFPLVPSAHLRFELNSSHASDALEQARPTLAVRLCPALLRQRHGDLAATG